MTLDEFKNTEVTSQTKVLYKGRSYEILGFNYLSGTIRLKGQFENINADYTECTFITKNRFAKC